MTGLLTLAILRGQHRSFRSDAMAAVEMLRPPLKVMGKNEIPGPCVITVNHYTRPGFQAWWLALAVSATFPIEVHWVVTSAWRYKDRLRSWTITPLSYWFLKHAAAVYDLIRMPPMPPRPDETHLRAQAVREILGYARRADCAVIGLAPEGGDFSSPGEVAELPAGAGRLLLHLAELGLAVLPVGAFEAEDLFCLNIGQAYRLVPPPFANRKVSDAWARQTVRWKIEELLGK